MADLPPKHINIELSGSPNQPAFQGKPSFSQKLISITVTLAPTQSSNQPVTFAGTGSNTITLSGFRTSVRIGNFGGAGGTSADVRIFGMHENTINQLSALGYVFNSIAKNSIVISAGDKISGLSPVFGGTINVAIPDYNSSPNVPFVMQCRSGYFSGITPVVPSSFAQPTDVATIMSGFAAKMGRAFENNGVTVQLPPSYFSGDIRTQIIKCAKAAHINWDFVEADTKLAIWPIGGSRTSKQGQNIPLISASTGMINYPTLSTAGLMIVQSLFNPQISFGSLIQVQSNRVPKANGTWVVQRLDLELDSLVPHGQWKSTATCFPAGKVAPPPVTK